MAHACIFLQSVFLSHNSVLPCCIEEAFKNYILLITSLSTIKRVIREAIERDTSSIRYEHYEYRLETMRETEKEYHTQTLAPRNF